MDIDVKMKHAFELTKGELKTMFSVYKHEMKSDIDAIKRSVDKLSVSVERMNEENSKKEKIIGTFSMLWDDFEQDIESDRMRNIDVDDRMENSSRHILGAMRDFCLWHAEQECVSKSRIDFEIKMFHDSVTQELESILGKNFVTYYSSCINNDIYQFVVGMNKIMDDKNNSKKERLMEMTRVLTRKMLRLLRDCFITGKELLQEKK
jgi:hypothetical protein